MIFASNNQNKIRELKKYFKDYQIKGLKESGLDIDIDEDQPTFAGNASKKAMEIYNLTHEPVIADDSGLCIDAFDGWPGVMTHRFLGDSTPYERNEYILNKMKNLKDNQRGCTVECVIAYVDKNGKLHIFEGKFKSSIAHAQQGENYFGFDSIVYTDNTKTKTMAMLTDEQKLKINARSLALQQLQDFINSQKN